MSLEHTYLQAPPLATFGGSSNNNATKLLLTQPNLAARTQIMTPVLHICWSPAINHPPFCCIDQVAPVSSECTYLCKPFDNGNLCNQRCEKETAALRFKPRVLPKLRQCGPPASCSLKNNTNATRQEGFLLSHFLVSPLWSRDH